MRDWSARGGDIAERLLVLAANVIRLAERLPNRSMTSHIALQLVRSVTSAGANYQEARHAESRADFVHKVGVSAKELAETLYWLRLIEKLALLPAFTAAEETDQLIAILVASARTARAR
ncbi:MAG TPA: four helix bundle protein [Polyangiaceae bacterium]